MQAYSDVMKMNKCSAFAQYLLAVSHSLHVAEPSLKGKVLSRAPLLRPFAYKHQFYKLNQTTRRPVQLRRYVVV
jgi:hypothetical protein